MGPKRLLCLAICLSLAGCENSSRASDSQWQPAMNAAAISLPKLKGRIVDDAALISPPTEALLVGRLKSLEASTTDQFVVVTVSTLEGRAIEDFGYQLASGWGVGQSGKNNGVLLIVAPKERKVRIEVGTGLEPVLTNALCARIIGEEILPHFNNGAMERRIVAGVDAVLAILEHGGSVAAERKAA